MPKSYYLPSDDAGKDASLDNLAGKLPGYSAAPGLTATDMGFVTADAAFFTCCLDSSRAGRRVFAAMGGQQKCRRKCVTILGCGFAQKLSF